MNKKISLILLVLLILCSGCTAQYTLSIQEDLSVKESFTAMEDAEFYNEYTHSSVQKVIGFILEPNLDYLNENGFTITEIINKRDAGVEIENSYKSIEEYKEKSKVTNQLADDWTYEENGDEITLTIKGAFSQEEQSQDGRYVVDEAQINIQLPFTVVSHNADEHEEGTDIYTWSFDQNTEEKEITITFNKNIERKFSPVYIVIGVMVAIILIIVYIIFAAKKENKKNNQV